MNVIYRDIQNNYVTFIKSFVDYIGQPVEPSYYYLNIYDENDNIVFPESPEPGCARWGISKYGEGKYCELEHEKIKDGLYVFYIHSTLFKPNKSYTVRLRYLPCSATIVSENNEIVTEFQLHIQNSERFAG